MKFITSIPKSLGIYAETYRHLRRAKASPAESLAIKNQWAENILSRLNVDLQITGVVSDLKPLLFVGNHISYLDILLMMKATKDCSFVAKQELASWPIFGTAAKYMDTVFVKRENTQSRRSARKNIYEALQNDKRLVLFPSGTTCLEERKSWRRGAFEIAHEAKVLIQPFRISYKPLRTVAYIDKDRFPLHLNKLVSCSTITASLEFHPPVPVLNPVEDCLYWQYWSRGAVPFLKSSSPSSDNRLFDFGYNRVNQGGLRV